MIKLEKTEVVGLKHAIRGMRNPMNSWDQSDSQPVYINNGYEEAKIDILSVGDKDLDLMKRLKNAGPDHRKFMRMMVVYVDITAPLYWWKEFDTYKVGTVANSCSTMHKLSDKEFELGDFSNEHIIRNWDGDHNDAIYYKDPPENSPIKNPMMFSPFEVLRLTIAVLNTNREAYIMISEQLRNDMEPNERHRLQKLQKEYWWQMIQLLPSSYNQKRTVMLNYEVLRNMYHNRKNHKLDEWHGLCDWIDDLPYSELIVVDSGLKEEALKKAIDLLDYCNDLLVRHPEYMFGPETQKKLNDAYQTLREHGMILHG